MSVFWGIISIVAIFCLVIITHEIGHFTMCRLCGVYVYKFSLGMGPKLLSFQGKETEYALRLFPVGGYCMMMGEDEESTDPRSFHNKKAWQRVLVLAAGSLMNMLTAIIIFIIIFIAIGVSYRTNEVGEVPTGQPAAMAGIRSGDFIVEINGQPIRVWNDISPAVALREQGQVVDVTVLRNGEQLEFSMQPYFNEEDKGWKIGVAATNSIVVIRQNFFSAISMGVKESFQFTKQLILGLIGMVRGTVEPDVTGFVGVGTMIYMASRHGMELLLEIAAFFCVNLAVINLLPIPALDGSRIVFIAIEKLRGRPINREIEGTVHFIGFMLLIGLMVAITIKDIFNLDKIINTFK
jgi:regulator of sigma E protease